MFSPKELKKDFTDNDARKLFAGLFTKDPAGAEKDAVINFGPGLELTIKSHPSEFKPDHSQALAKIRDVLVGVSDKPINDIKTAFCRPPYALTEEMVMLYLFALVRSGAWEMALNPATPIKLANDKPLPGNRLTAHTLGLVKWNSQLDKALLGARIVASVQKGWNEVLPFARVLDDTLKPAPTPEEELQRNDQLMAILGKLKSEVPEVESEHFIAFVKAQRRGAEVTYRDLRAAQRLGHFGVLSTIRCSGARELQRSHKIQKSVRGIRQCSQAARSRHRNQSDAGLSYGCMRIKSQSRTNAADAFGPAQIRYAICPATPHPGAFRILQTMEG